MKFPTLAHPTLEQAKDPGRDANDLFGITLDYYNGDYIRSNTNISNPAPARILSGGK